MQIQALYVQAFRNLQNVLLSLHPRFNVLWGENGQGKTNVLEALYLLSALRSFRTHQSEDWVPFGQSKMDIQGRLSQEGIEHVLSVSVDLTLGAKKHVLLDGKRCRNAVYLQTLRAVVFVPEDLRLPKASPEQRRTFLDRAAFHLYPQLLQDLQIYENTLRQRNAVLKQHRRDLLPVYNEQLAQAAALVVRWRTEYVAAWSPWVTNTFEQVSQSQRCASVRYRCGWWRTEEGNSPAEALLQALEQNQARDWETGYTHAGPHTDDLEFLLDEKLAKVHASQGQMRALVLAAKMAEIQLLLSARQTPPLLLLDDVNSELDAQRSQLLFAFLEQIPCQTVVTTTDPTLLPWNLPVDMYRLFHVEHGRIA